MTFEQTVLLGGFAVSTGMSVIAIVKMIWGGGAAQTQQWASLEKACATSVEALRNELLLKIDNQSQNAGNAVMTMGNRIHAIELEAANTRADMMRELIHYIRKDDYNAGLNDMRRELRDGLGKVDGRLGEMQDLILHFGGDVPRHKVEPKVR